MEDPRVSASESALRDADWRRRSFDLLALPDGATHADGVPQRRCSNALAEEKLRGIMTDA